MGRILAAILIALVAAARVGHASPPADGAWSGFGGIYQGCNGQIRAIAALPNGDLIVGGAFTVCGHLRTHNIARWDGSQWHALIDASSGYEGVGAGVDALQVVGSAVYVGGEFGGSQPASAFLALWNGSTWQNVPEPSDIVRALAYINGDLIVGGDFTTINSSPASHIARINGTTWSAYGSGTNQSVYSIAAFNNQVYVGGDFSQAGGNAAARVARWNGSAWEALGSGANANVYAVYAANGALYVGGAFSTIGGVSANGIARYNGTTFTSLGSGSANGITGSSATVYAINAVGSDIFATGDFFFAGGNYSLFSARWNGSSWSSIGDIFGIVRCALSVGTTLYFGGYFNTVSSTVPANSIVRRDATGNLSGLGASPGSGSIGVMSAVMSGSDLWAGGDFRQVGSVTAQGIARWNGATWTAAGAGINNAVYAIAPNGSSIYVGGDFTLAGGAPASRVARWNGTAWSTLGSGVDDNVYALAVQGTNLFAGGDFAHAGGTAAAHVARWNGSAWSTLGNGFDASVRALTVFGSDIIAGGEFEQSGSTMLEHIARWNGSAWSALGAGMNGAVRALVVWNGALYAGGDFTFAGGNAINGLARWDGSTWQPVGVGLDIFDTVSSLTTAADGLYAAGEFYFISPNIVQDIARWDGSTWHALGAGTAVGVSGGPLRAVAGNGTDVYAVGNFDTAGSTLAVGVARWRIGSDRIFANGFDGS